jgi:hypothetical protein
VINRIEKILGVQIPRGRKNKKKAKKFWWMKEEIHDDNPYYMILNIEKAFKIFQ